MEADLRPWSPEARRWAASSHIPIEETLSSMTYVITQPCVGVKDASCVDVCPVDCIHPAEGEADFESVNMLYINPDECIDCGACEPACPVSAIFEESAVPAQWKEYIQINADYYRDK
jgi:NAD-dependent dihydropyrimidine dehydrogenase PreA subunit